MVFWQYSSSHFCRDHCGTLSRALSSWFLPLGPSTWPFFCHDYWCTLQWNNVIFNLQFHLLVGNLPLEVMDDNLFIRIFQWIFKFFFIEHFISARVCLCISNSSECMFAWLRLWWYVISACCCVTLAVWGQLPCSLLWRSSLGLGLVWLSCVPGCLNGFELVLVV